MDDLDICDELENLISSINSLIDETSLPDYRNALIGIKEDAIKELVELEDYLAEEKKREVNHQESEYWRSQF